MCASCISGNLERAKARIEAAARRAGRSPNEIRLMGVTKTQPAEVVKEAIEAGISLLGENYVQEAEKKIAELGGMANKAEWHMIGHLQRNKAKKACKLFSCVETVDNVKLAEALSRHAEASGRQISLLVQVNIAKEPQKSGVVPEEAELLVSRIVGLSHVQVSGLMVIPPYSDDVEKTRAWFRKARLLRDQLAIKFKGKADFKELSMGMSNDFEAAIEEGSTIVRLGTILFGPRRSPR